MINPTTRSALMASGATMIAEVDSLPDDAADREETSTYTRLGLWWIKDEDRPFYAVVEGLCGPAAEEWMEDRFRAVAYGTMDRALNSFDPSNLHADLLDAIPGDAQSVYPDANVLRRRNAKARRGYQGPASFDQALRWLYDDMGDASATAIAKRAADDWGLVWRTIYSAMNGKGTAWSDAFVLALRHFDRGAWRASRKSAFDKVAGGLDDASAYAKGDTSKGRVAEGDADAPVQ